MHRNIEVGSTLHINLNYIDSRRILSRFTVTCWISGCHQGNVYGTISPPRAKSSEDALSAWVCQKHKESRKIDETAPFIIAGQ